MCMIWNIPTGDDNDGNTREKETMKETKMQPPKQTMTTRQKCIELSKTKFKTPDEYKSWRIDNELVENLNEAQESELLTLFYKLKGIK